MTKEERATPSTPSILSFPILVRQYSIQANTCVWLCNLLESSFYGRTYGIATGHFQSGGEPPTVATVERLSKNSRLNVLEQVPERRLLLTFAEQTWYSELRLSYGNPSPAFSEQAIVVLFVSRFNPYFVFTNSLEISRDQHTSIAKVVWSTLHYVRSVFYRSLECATSTGRPINWPPMSSYRLEVSLSSCQWVVSQSSIAFLASRVEAEIWAIHQAQVVT